MRSTSTLHISVYLLGLAGLAGPLLALAPVARAAALRLPVWTPGSNVAAPYFRGDVLELQLTAGAARVVLPRGAGPTRAVPVGRLGLPAVDAVAASVGAVAFEPEFRSETPPAPGDGPDFTAFQLVHLAPGTDLVLWSGLLAYLSNQDAIDVDWTGRHVSGLEESVKAAHVMAPSLAMTAAVIPPGWC